jgi:WD40 repeat protein
MLCAVGATRPDRILLAAARNALMSLRAAQPIEQLCTLSGAHDDLITAIAIDPLENQRAVSVGLDSRARFWRIKSNGELTNNGEVALPAQAHDVAWAMGAGDKPGPVAAALENGAIAICDPSTGSLLSFDCGSLPVRSVSFFPDGMHLACGGDDGVLRVIELPSGAQAQGGLLQHYNGIRAVRISCCGRYLAFVSDDEKGALFDLDRRQVVAFGTPGDAITTVAWHPTQATLVAGTDQGAVLHYDVAKGELSTNAQGKHLHRVQACTWSCDGKTAYTASRDGTIIGSSFKRKQGWGIASRFAPAPSGYALCVGWVENGARVAAGYSDGSVALWPSEPGPAVPVILEMAHAKPVYGLAVSHDGKSVATGSVDKRVKVWDVGAAMQVHDLAELHNKPIYSVSYSPDDRMIATGSGDTYLVVYDIEERKKKAAEAFGPEEYWHFAVRNKVLNAVAWSPNGKHIAVGLSNHTVVILDVTNEGLVSKGPTLKLHDDFVSAVAWNKQGTRLVSVGYDRKIVVWDAASYRPLIQRVVEHQEAIQALAIRPCDDVIATGSWDGTIRFWHPDTLEPILVVGRPHFSAVEGLDFAPDGRTMVSASSDCTLGIWDIIDEG